MTRGTDRLRRLVEPVGLAVVVLVLLGVGFVAGSAVGSWLATDTTPEGQTAEYDTRFGPHLVVTTVSAVAA